VDPHTGEPDEVLIGGTQLPPSNFICNLIPNLSSEVRLLSDIALIVTAVGVLGVVFGLRQSYRERLRQFEEKYVERYWRILDELSLEAVRGPFSGEVGRSDEKAIRSYIALCEDELEMRHYGYIADSTYELWSEGTRSQLRQQPFEIVWKQVQQETATDSASKYEYLHVLMGSDTVKAGNQNDPLKMSGFQRTLRGLRGLKGV